MEPIDPALWDDPELRRALIRRDITTVYRLLADSGVPKGVIAALTGQKPSDVSEIIAGRLVHSYDLLVRIAHGLGVPRGWLGLAYSGNEDPSTRDETEEVDEDVERRNFLALAGLVVIGSPVFGDPKPLTVRDVITAPPGRVGATDVERYAATVTRLGILDRESGGMAARQALAATATAGETMLKARASDEVQRELRYAISEAHRLAGWASGDVGLMDHCRHHMHRALDHAAGDGVRVAQVLCSASDMEKHHGAPDTALKLLQLAQVSGDVHRDAQVGAVIGGLTASTYQRLGNAELARRELRRSRKLFAEAEPDKALPFFAFYGPGSGLLAAVGSKLGDYDAARADVRAALRTRPEFDVRCNALDTIVLATILVNAGEIRDGVATTRRALELVIDVGSQRVRDRLEPLEKALAARRDGTCQDLARRARELRVPSVDA
ncbi:hypothetical protein [Lentzea flaviverrucosa]|uniref:HTH cro/C1-type domain-containing protein n=1 Tax=Lentzea flaviverrucosa TaxID=200379 RepID=A0A1H9XAH8_9PSEU|nr:hypothetical protein [Lentzea flaviverrucosa]RDI21699.1 hypothetical protein DFR72_113246 [Lentzea flaviverrucosa]SES43061.1 hypothetical protein SAMN05216195_11434 [Lentzea flaviverrucosa]